MARTPCPHWHVPGLSLRAAAEVSDEGRGEPGVNTLDTAGPCPVPSLVTTEVKLTRKGPTLRVMCARGGLLTPSAGPTLRARWPLGPSLPPRWPPSWNVSMRAQRGETSWSCPPRVEAGWPAGHMTMAATTTTAASEAAPDTEGFPV